jgi:hypothetical protein
MNPTSLALASNVSWSQAKETNVFPLLVHLDQGSKRLPALDMALSSRSELEVVDVDQQHGSILRMAIETLPIFGNPHEYKAADFALAVSLPAPPRRQGGHIMHYWIIVLASPMLGPLTLWQRDPCVDAAMVGLRVSIFSITVILGDCHPDFQLRQQPLRLPLIE